MLGLATQVLSGEDPPSVGRERAGGSRACDVPTVHLMPIHLLERAEARWRGGGGSAR
jgi:hypothetical protein